MRMYPTIKKRFCWFAGGAVAVGALAIVMGLMPTASAQTGPASVTAAGPASAAAAPRSSVCHWLPTPPSIWVGDASAKYFLIWGNYNRPGSTGVAYKVTGEFAHSTTMAFTAYDDMINIRSPAYSINDSAIIPNPGSVNPFVPGTRVMGKPRNYTVWIWPDSVPVPAGMKNVVLYPTKPAIPGAKAARWSVTLRMYHMQPGYRAIAESPNITAVSAANPSKPVRCPLTVAGSIASQFLGLFAHIEKWGGLQAPPEPTTGNKLYFTRYPAASGLGFDGYPGVLPFGCAQYLTATLPVNQISVITMHQVAPYFNNDLVTPLTVMKDWPIRYQSLGITYFTFNQRLYRSLFLNTDDSVYTSDGSWVTVFLPSEPRLTPEQIRLVRAAARALNFNVLQLPPKGKGPVAKLYPEGQLVLRPKAISPSFPYGLNAVPCWAQHHDYKTWTHQTSPAFFAKYASSPSNMGPYYLDGVKLSFAHFMSQYSTK